MEQMLRDACLLRGVHHNNVKSVAAVCVEPGLAPLLVYRFDNDCNLKIYLQLCRTAQVRQIRAMKTSTSQSVSQLERLHSKIAPTTSTTNSTNTECTCPLTYLQFHIQVCFYSRARTCLPSPQSVLTGFPNFTLTCSR